MLCDIVLKYGELVKVIEGPHTGATGIIQDVLGKRTYVLSNNVVVDRYQIEIISKEGKAIELIERYLKWLIAGNDLHDIRRIKKEMKELINGN